MYGNKRNRHCFCISVLGGLLLLLASLFQPIRKHLVCHASSFHEPHSHTGKVPPFQPGDPKISLDKTALTILSSGKPYQTQIQSGSSGRGLVIQDIKAPTFIVWNNILDFDHYSQMVPKTIESKNYDIQQQLKQPTISSSKQKEPAPSQIIFTRMKIGFSIMSFEFFIRHLYFPTLHSLTWTLDYTKKSDLDDSVGYWYVIPHPEYPQKWSRVYYSVQVALYDWVPKFIVDFMSTKALTDATAWVKKYSELQYEKTSQKINMIGRDDDPSLVKQKKGDNRWKFWRKGKKDLIHLEQVNQGGGRTTVVQDVSQNHILISWTRITLISIVFALATFNIHLWLSK